MATAPKVSGVRSVTEIMAMAARRLQIPDTDTGVFFDYVQQFMWTYRTIANPTFKEIIIKEIPANRIVRQPADMEDFFKIGWVKRDGKIQEVGPNDESTLSPTGIENSEASQIDMLAPGFGYGSPLMPTSSERISGRMDYVKPAIVQGAYVYNKRGKTFWLMPNVSWPNFYLLYRSNSMDTAPNTLMPMIDANALLNYILHNYTTDKNMGGAAQKYAQAWYESKDLMEENAAAFDMMEFINAVDQVRGYVW